MMLDALLMIGRLLSGNIYLQQNDHRSNLPCSVEGNPITSDSIYHITLLHAT
jgi:hypothetical protein